MRHLLFCKQSRVKAWYKASNMSYKAFPFYGSINCVQIQMGRSKFANLNATSLGQLVYSLTRASHAGKLCPGNALRQVSSEAIKQEHEIWEKGGGLVHNSAQVHDSAMIEVGAVVQANAIVGANVHIGVGSVVGPHVNIGSDSLLGFNVALQNCSLGVSCIIHNGVCIGQDEFFFPWVLAFSAITYSSMGMDINLGFGFTVNKLGEVLKKPQILKVQIGNFVEIGANSCIDRGSWRNTVIGDHTKIDNLVQIGHNVVIGRCCMLCGQVGLGGSVTLGDYVVLGGKAGVADHITIASKVRVAAKSGVMSDIKKVGDYAGFPAVPAQEWRRSTVVLRRFGRHSNISSSFQSNSVQNGSSNDKAN